MPHPTGELGEFVLPYEFVRTAPDPDARLLEFLQSTYEASPNAAPWDRGALGRGDLHDGVEVGAALSHVVHRSFARAGRGLVVVLPRRAVLRGGRSAAGAVAPLSKRSTDVTDTALDVRGALAVGLR
jgi:hypothetical protein